MRSNYVADWAFGIKGAIENIVRNNYPQDLRTWPLLQTFNFEGYKLSEKYMVIILFDKLSGIAAGPGTLKEFDFNQHPQIPPLPKDLEIWQFYLRQKWELKNEDAAFLIPIYDSGKNSALEDYKLFTPDEQYFWDQQITYIVHRYKTYLQTILSSKPSQPNNIIYNVSGTNARVNINSKDSSTNIVNTETTYLFSQMRDLLDQISNEGDRQKIAEAIDGMEISCGSNDFVMRYQKFMSLLADHITIFAPFLPALAELLK